MKALRLAVAAISFGCAVVPVVFACNGAVTLEGVAAKGTNGESMDGSLVGSEASANNAPGTLVFDLEPCTGVTGNLARDAEGAWSLDVGGTCGASGHVSARFTSYDVITYPQRCEGLTHAEVVVGSEGDAAVAASSCYIRLGPTKDDEGKPLMLGAEVPAADPWDAPEGGGNSAIHQLKFTSADLEPPPLPTSRGLFVDGVACTTTETDLRPPDGGSFWGLTLYAKCGSIGGVTVQVQSRDDVAYPISCVRSGNFAPIGLFDWEPDAGPQGLAHYEGSSSQGPCFIETGPTVSNEAEPIRFRATVVGGSTGMKTRSVAYVP